MADKPKKDRRSPGENARPTCPKCQAPMNPAGYVPGLGHLADRIFKCRKCGHILIKPE
jgi:tRNA(Ile2) C34 agmatinyltransferase TiaS